MVRKIFIAYVIYVAVVFLANTYIFKEEFIDAVVKAVLSGVVFTFIYFVILAKAEKRKNEEKGN
jgi:uncharacterized MnhB-related membrane protein